MKLSPKKRPSNDDNEFMPVTKRLNLLSIDNSRESTSDSAATREEENELNAYEVAHYVNQQQQELVPSLAQQLYLNELYRSYSPSLSCSQNPNYYEANRILYEAHQQRIIRMQSQKARS